MSKSKAGRPPVLEGARRFEVLLEERHFDILDWFVVTNRASDRSDALRQIIEQWKAHRLWR